MGVGRGLNLWRAFGVRGSPRIPRRPSNVVHVWVCLQESWPANILNPKSNFMWSAEVFPDLLHFGSGLAVVGAIAG